MNSDREVYLNRSEAAAFLKVKPGTLSAWACCGRHNLPLFKLGRTVRYRLSDLKNLLKRTKIKNMEKKNEKE